jgi:hypothetical protein
MRGALSREIVWEHIADPQEASTRQTYDESRNPAALTGRMGGTLPK